MLLEISSISKKYKNKIALDDVSFNLSMHESVGLLGPNGSGKTTLLKIIASLIRPSSGTLKFDIKTSSKIGAVLDEYKFLKRITAKHNLDYFFESIENIKVENNNTDWETYASNFKLQNDLNKKFKHLSSGMKKKIDLISVFGKQNLINLLDEPTNTLETESISYLLEIINHKRISGCSFIIASHDRSFLSKCCSRILVLNKGAVINELSGQML